MAARRALVWLLSVSIASASALAQVLPSPSTPGPQPGQAQVQASPAQTQAAPAQMQPATAPAQAPAAQADPQTPPRQAQPAQTQSAQPTQTQPIVSQPSLEMFLAGRSLRRSAQSLLLDASAPPGRATRLVALVEMAHHLDPGDPDTNLMLADIRQSQQLYPQAVGHLRCYLQVEPQDHATWLRMLGLAMEALDQADQRLILASDVLSREDVPPAVRAMAGAELARLRLATGDRAGALEALGRARQLDPFAQEIIEAQQALASDGPPGQAAALVAMLQGQPRDPRISRRLADLLAREGLFTQAAAFSQFGWAVLALRMDLPITHDDAVSHFNALLDAGQYDRVIDQAQPLTQQMGPSLDLLSLLAEAYVGADQPDRARQLLVRMRELAAGLSPLEQAWFYALSDPDPAKALPLAQQAVKLQGDSPIARRVLAGAALESADPQLRQDAAATLASLACDDPYAAWLLARYLLAQNQAQQAQAVLTSATLPRSGPASRLLRRLAARHQLTLNESPSPHAQQILDELARLDRRYLEMALRPSQFVELALRPVGDGQSLPGEDVDVVAVLTSKAPVPVPLGPAGLLEPVAALVASVGADQFEDLPRVVFAAPRYLQPGQSVQVVVPLNVGRLGRLLDDRPLENLSVSVRAVADPAGGDARRGSAAGITAGPGTLRRRTLMAISNVSITSQLQSTLESGADVGSRIVAARQVGALVRLAQRGVNTQALPIPDEPARLALVSRAMADASPAVRADMVAALEDGALEPDYFAAVSQGAADSAPLVRMRLAELAGRLAGQGAPTTQQAQAAGAEAGSAVQQAGAVLKELGEDPDRLVALMSRAPRATK